MQKKKKEKKMYESLWQQLTRETGLKINKRSKRRGAGPRTLPLNNIRTIFRELATRAKRFPRSLIVKKVINTEGSE